MRTLLILLIAVILTAGSVFATTCVDIPHPRKALSHVCGVIVDPAGGMVANAKVQILKGDSVVVEAQSDSNGKFSIETLKEGSFQMRVAAEGFSTFEVPIRMRNPKAKCKTSLQVTLAPGEGHPCGSSVVLKKN
jgi:Carboxypeptidase regulatory-like domain